MSVYDITDPALPLPAQIVVDSSFVLALRETDDNPNATHARAFARRIRERALACEMIAWLLLPVLQESYHVILASGLQRAWEAMNPSTRPANWLQAYKRDPPRSAPFTKHYHSIPRIHPHRVSIAKPAAQESQYR